MQTILFVINPVSGGTDKSQLISEIETRCNQNSISFKIIKTTGENDVARVGHEIDQLNPQRLIVAGGDGTINLFATLAAKRNLSYGIIPSGSANGLATELGITMENALDIAFGSRQKKVDIITINEETKMLHMADLGLNASLVKRYELENRRGFFGYAISAIKEFQNVEEEFDVQIQYNGETVKKNSPFVVIANASKYGTGFAINPGADISDGQFEVCILKPLSTELILNDLFINSETEDRQLFEVIKTDRCSITCNKPIDFQSDGEYLGQKAHLTIEINDCPVAVLIP